MEKNSKKRIKEEINKIKRLPKLKKSVALDPEVYEALSSYSQSFQVSISSIMELSIRKFLDMEEERK